MEVELSKSECFEQLRYREIHISRVHCRHSDTSQQFLLSSIQLSVLSNPKFIVPASSDTRDETRQSPCEPSSCRHHNDDDNIPLPTHPPPPTPETPNAAPKSNLRSLGQKAGKTSGTTLISAWSSAASSAAASPRS